MNETETRYQSGTAASSQTMTRDEAKEYIKSQWRYIMREWTGTAKSKVQGKETYICPICGHGKNGDGVKENPKSKDPNGIKCFGACGTAGDIIEFWETCNHVGYNEALQELAEKVGITISKGSKAAPAQIGNATPPAERPRPASYDGEINYNPYFKECFNRLQNENQNAPAVEYLKKRGISLGTAISCKIGYDPAADPANAPGALEGQRKPHPARRLIIPCNQARYVTRAIDEEKIDRRYWKMNNRVESGQAGGGVFVPEFAAMCDYLFICEGIFDALSIMEAAAQVGTSTAAIALNSTSNVDALLETFKEKDKRPAGIVLIALDNDEAGTKAADKLAEGLIHLTIPHARANICEGYKDPNEALVKAPEQFKRAIKATQEKATKPDGIAAYLSEGGYIRDAERMIAPAPTGFKQLDIKCGGGIQTGLYVIAAPSSLGKTTFCLQMACNIAQSGRDVLYFAMEQSRMELVNKAVARLSFENEADRNHPKNAITAEDCRKNETWRNDNIEKYRHELARRVGNHLSIIEWNLDATTANIKKKIIQHMRSNPTEKPPIVIIDYLQLIQGEKINGRKQGAKEAMDEAATELKKLSRAQNVPIIAISSINRASYYIAFSMEAIKESGGIEYTADVVLGLQYSAAAGITAEDMRGNSDEVKKLKARVKEAKAVSPRQIELVCDKNRFGIGHFSVSYDYYPKHDYFVESLRKPTT